MAEFQLPKLVTRVRFPSSAPNRKGPVYRSFSIWSPLRRGIRSLRSLDAKRGGLTAPPFHTFSPFEGKAVC